jgi:hypothetical protein
MEHQHQQGFDLGSQCQPLWHQGSEQGLVRLGSQAHTLFGIFQSSESSGSEEHRTVVRNPGVGIGGIGVGTEVGTVGTVGTESTG